MFFLAYYYDKNATTKLREDAGGNVIVEFPIDKQYGPPRAGLDTVYASFYVKNEHYDPIELRPATTDPDLKIAQYPEFLEPGEIQKVTLAFSPAANRHTKITGSWGFDIILYSTKR